jgi:hypothetical protein
MADSCGRCGAKLGLLDKVKGDGLCSSCRKAVETERAQARNAYVALVRQAVLGLVPIDAVSAEIANWRAATGLAQPELARLQLPVWREALEAVLADDILSQDEEDRLNRVGAWAGVDASIYQALGPDLLGRMMIARINDGRLPRVQMPKVMLKKGEVAYLELPASLMKEVVVRETRGAYSSWSFRVAKGVRFTTGGYRGRSVVVGTHLEVADRGPLTLTSMRAVYTGMRKTMELPLSKLLSVSVFNDGIQFQMSNRQSAPLFKVPDGRVAAAVVNAAYQQL